MITLCAVQKVNGECNLEPSTVSRSQPASKILGIETSTMRCEVALAENATTVGTATVPEGCRASSLLVPIITGLCREHGWSLRDLDLVCVDVGPGSYTGLRVGLTCAKVLAYAARAPLVTAVSLEVVARNLLGDRRSLEVAYDASRGQVFSSRIQWISSDLGVSEPRATPLRIVAAEQWAAELDRSALVTGPALTKYRSLIPPGCAVADESHWWPAASHVIELGRKQLEAGPPADYWTIEPFYLRPSAAEEKASTK